jgi:hypothetical protein
VRNGLPGAASRAPFLVGKNAGYDRSLPDCRADVVEALNDILSPGVIPAGCSRRHFLSGLAVVGETMRMQAVVSGANAALAPALEQAPRASAAGTSMCGAPSAETTPGAVQP